MPISNGKLPDAPDIQVDYGPVLPDFNQTLYENVQNDTSAVWSDYMITNRYESDKHIYMLSYTSPNGFRNAQKKISTVGFVQLGSPTLLWICDWTVARMKKQPKVPDTDVNDLDWILLDECIEPVMVTVASDGVTPLYRISGTYFYGHTNPTSDVIKELSFPRPPWMKDQVLRTITESMFEDNLSTTGNRTLSTGGSSPGLRS